MKHLKLALLSAALGSVILALPAAAQECANKPVVVGLLPKLDTDPYFQVAKGGAEEAAKEIGGSVIQAAPSQATAEAQIEFINNFVAQKVGVIAIAANDANAVAPRSSAPRKKASMSSRTIRARPPRRGRSSSIR